MKSIFFATALCLPLIGAHAATPSAPPPSPTPQADELASEPFLFEIIQYLYRWYLDENHAQTIVGDGSAVFLVREETKSNDPDDNSRYGTIILPQIGYSLTVKKADYKIEELGIEVHSDGFEIVNVTLDLHEVQPEGFEKISIPYETLIASAHESRADSEFPEGDLLQAMFQAAKREIQQYVNERAAADLPLDLHGHHSLESFLASQQEVYLSPLPAVANDVWMFWETGGMLLHFSTELDLRDPALWDNQHLEVELFDLDEQTVVSLHEVAGSNAYLTRDQVGRILYNCLVLGKRMVVEARPLPAATP